MKRTYSIGAKLELLKLRYLLENNLIKDYRDFKENPIGSGKVSYKYTTSAPIKRISFEDCGIGFEFFK